MRAWIRSHSVGSPADIVCCCLAADVRALRRRSAEKRELQPPPKEEPVLPYDSGLPDSVEPAPEHESVGEEFNLDFGQDFDSSAWNVYWGDEKPG